MTLLALKGAPAGELIVPPAASNPARVPERPPLGRRIEASPLARFGRYRAAASAPGSACAA